jgi:hypothetical protein
MTDAERELERARALAEVMKREAEKAQSEKGGGGADGGFIGKYVSLGIATLAFFYIFFASPPWLDPQPIEPPSAEAEGAALRFTMYIQAQKIEMYRQENGRLPETLEEAGPTKPGISYVRRGTEGYELIGESDQAIIQYSSNQSLQEFLGDAEDFVLDNQGAD